MRLRLDNWLVNEGIAQSRSQARSLIKEGVVFVNDKVVVKPAANVPDGAKITVSKLSDYVGRGARKLDSVFSRFDIDIEGAVVADIGASTGGFTDYLLRAGAKRVFAVDVGKGQLASSLLDDERVENLEGIDVRDLEFLPEQVDLLVADLSFISLRLVIEHFRDFLKPGAKMLVLFKPQFEVGKGGVNKSGVVLDSDVRKDLLNDFIDWAEERGIETLKYLESELTGKKGNIEYFLLME